MVAWFPIISSLLWFIHGTTHLHLTLCFTYHTKMRWLWQTDKHNFIFYMWGRRLYRERTGVYEMTVKRTRLCYWIARPAKPGVQSSNTSRVRFTVNSHTPVRSRFYHIHIMYKRNWDGSWLMNLTQKSYSHLHIFSNSQCVPLLCWVLVKHAI